MTRYWVAITLLLAFLLVGTASAANLWNFSEQINNSAWSRSYVYKFLNDTQLDPNGNYTADTYNVTTGDQNHYVGQAIPVTAGLPYTISAHFKPFGSNTAIQLTFASAYFGSVQYTNANISPDSCAITVTGENTTNTATAANGSWCRISHTATALSSGNANGFIFFTGNSTDAERGPQYDGAGYTQESVMIWGMQAEQASAPTAYGGETAEASLGEWANFTPVSSDNKTIFGSATVQFTDTSTADNPTGYLWKYTNVTGDNVERTFSTSQNPSQVFVAPPVSGAWNYSISLTVTNATGSNTTYLNSHFVNVTRYSQDGTGDLPILPDNHILRQSVTSLPIDDESATWIAAIHTNYGGDPYLKPLSTKRINWIGEDAPTYLFLASGNALYSDLGEQMAWPDDTAYEPTSDMQADVYDRDNNIGYEYSYVNTDGHPGGLYPNGTHGARYYQKIDYDNLTVHRPAWQPGGTVSGLPRTPTLLSIADMQSASITHALGMGFYTTDGTYIWPASSGTTAAPDTEFPPMGARIRLKSSFSLSGFNSNATKVLQALKTYGGIYTIRVGASTTQFLAEAGSLSSADIAQLNTVDITDFEFVDESSLMTSSGSYAVLGYGTAPTAHFYMNETSTVEEDYIPEYGAPETYGGYPLGGNYAGETSYPVYTAGVDAVVAGGSTYNGSIVSTKAELLAALAGASTGDVVYINASANIDMTNSENVAIPENVTIASNRGSGGSLGGRINTTTAGSGWNKPIFRVSTNNVRFTGLRLEGEALPMGSNGAGEATYRVGIWVDGATGFVVDNCDLYGFAYADIYLNGCPTAGRPWIHHNYIHESQNLHEGYGVDVGGGDALIEANIFYKNRHSVTGDGETSEKYTVRYNKILDTTTWSVTGMNHIDVHGTGTTEAYSGDQYEIYHNSFLGGHVGSVHQRGYPTIGTYIYNNSIYGDADYTGSPTPFYQTYKTPPGAGHMYVTNNSWNDVEYPTGSGIIWYQNGGLA